MNDSPTPSSPPPGDEAPRSSPPPFRMPDGAPAGTSARGSLATQDTPSPSSQDDEWFSPDEMESADGRPIESPYHDESAMRRALLSDDVLQSPAFDSPLDTDSHHDLSHIEAGQSYQGQDDDPYADSSYTDSYNETPTEMREPGELVEFAREEFTDTQLATAGSGGEPPANLGSTAIEEPFDDNAPANDREMGLMEHLGELRTRIMWCVAAIAVAMVVTWNFADRIEDLIIAPVITALKEAKVQGQPQVLTPTEGFMLQFNISLISALVVTAPFLIFQIWKFIEPAMTKREKRFTGILVPFSSLLFFMGCALAYAMSPYFFAFFAMFVPKGALANWSFAESAVLLGKMLLICGVCFQVPIFTIFLNKSGIVSRNILIEYWRHVVVVIFIVVAILTPTWDPVSLLVCALPPCFLYALSIWLVKWL